MTFPYAPEPMAGRALDERLADLRRIAQLADPVLRNLLITQRYHDLSLLLAGVLGRTNANWATFATWASKTAGQSIREEEVPPAFVDFLRREARLDERLARFYRNLGPLARFAPRLDAFDLARAIIQEVSRQIAEGNLRVYAELAPLFAEFAAGLGDRPPDSTGLDAFFTLLSAGPPERGGQNLLKSAFRSYATAAALATDDTARAQQMLLGNVLIGLHEQTRLQEHIAGALDAPFSERVYERFGGAGPRLLHPILRSILRNGVRLFARGLMDDWRRIATRFLMKLSAPNGEEIPLGTDLPATPFDPLLARLTLADLATLLSRFDPDLDTTRGSGATDWTRLSDRMKFIGELFRASQRDPSWFDQPFETLQRREIEAGRIPPGRL